MRDDRAVRQGAVVVVGSINVDLVIRAPRLPATGETVLGGEFERHGGGKGANQAVAAARAGAEIVFVAAAGTDEFGDEALRELQGEGVDTSRIARLADHPTGIALIVVDAKGENLIAVASGANAALEPGLVTRALGELQPDDVGLLSLELPDAPLLAAAQRFTEAGVGSVVLNPAPARELPPELLDLRPILTPNRNEALALGGGGSVDRAARNLHQRTRAPVVVTLGGEGALVVDAEGSERLPAPEVEPVDTTGAGDAFNGALAAALAQGHDLHRALRRAVAAGAYSVQVAGARSGMPSRANIDRLTSTGSGS